MAKVPSPEKMAGEIFKVFKEHNIWANEMLPFQTLGPRITDQGYRMTDFQTGVDHMKAKGWLIVKGKEGRYFLTEEGFKVM